MCPSFIVFFGQLTLNVLIFLCLSSKHKLNRFLKGIFLNRYTVLVGLDFPSQRPTDSKPSNTFLLELLGFILENNLFQSAGVNYLQCKRAVVGTRTVPLYTFSCVGLKRTSQKPPNHSAGCDT